MYKCTGWLIRLILLNEESFMRIEFEAINVKKSLRRKLREEVCKLRTGTLSFPASTLTTFHGIHYPISATLAHQT
jgi:hypothetical protein